MARDVISHLAHHWFWGHEIAGACIGLNSNKNDDETTETRRGHFFVGLISPELIGTKNVTVFFVVYLHQGWTNAETHWPHAFFCLAYVHQTL